MAKRKKCPKLEITGDLQVALQDYGHLRTTKAKVRGPVRASLFARHPNVPREDFKRAIKKYSQDKQNVKTKQKRIDKKRQRITEEQESADRTQQQIQNLQGEVQQAQQQIFHLQDEVKQGRHQIYYLQEENKQGQQKIQSLQKEVTQLEEAKVEVESKYAWSQYEREQENKHKAELEQKEKEHSFIITGLRDRNAQLGKQQLVPSVRLPLQPPPTTSQLEQDIANRLAITSLIDLTCELHEKPIQDHEWRDFSYCFAWCNCNEKKRQRWNWDWRNKTGVKEARNESLPVLVRYLRNNFSHCGKDGDKQTLFHQMYQQFRFYWKAAALYLLRYRTLLETERVALTKFCSTVLKNLVNLVQKFNQLIQDPEVGAQWKFIRLEK
jgi:hypothetical protein